MAVRTPGLSGVLLPAVRDAASLHQALDLGYRQVLVERGSLLAMVGPLAIAARQGIAIFVNLDGVEGLIHALDSTGLETGLRALASPAPQALAIAPALAIPHVVATVRAVTSVPLWGTGYVTTSEQAQRVLAAGAEVVSSSRREVWQDFQT